MYLVLLFVTSLFLVEFYRSTSDAMPLFICLCSAFSIQSDLVQNCDRVLQTAKAFVVSLASVESCALTESLTLLKCICSVSAKSNDMEKVKKTVTEVRNVVAEEVKTYCQAFELGVDPQLVDISSPCVSLRDVEKDFKLSVHVSSAHRLRMK